MKSYRIIFSVLLICLSVVASAASKNEPKPTQSSNASAEFDKLKELSGEWISRSASDPMSVTRHTYRVVSNGSAVMLTTDVPSEGPMITMFYLDGPRLMATHFFGGKNQPRYVATNSADPKAIVFKFKDATNLTPQMGYMSAVTILFGDSDHHQMKWTFTENGKNRLDTFDLERSK